MVGRRAVPRPDPSGPERSGAHRATNAGPVATPRRSGERSRCADLAHWRWQNSEKIERALRAPNIRAICAFDVEDKLCSWWEMIVSTNVTIMDIT
ncbi:jg9853 [Pararge aegeria aegeria]|uniref:Jg9853 protein n=1 Tax=Pararge aegeria aegeria TaxID=348720 RepID=A0A8S4QMB7_9NEOP|nr:jg9853 [Pararge aegeria aegeria]